jgi:SulP family sulfate permease
VYALFGSSRQVIVGPDIAISLLTASTIAPLANGDSARAAALAATIALLSGLLLLLGARAKFGAVATKLRYDAPIPVQGKPSIPFETAGTRDCRTW